MIKNYHAPATPCEQLLADNWVGMLVTSVITSKALPHFWWTVKVIERGVTVRID